MNILLLGSGGREHALAWKIRQSPLTKSLYIAPGNAGTAALGTNVSVQAEDFDGVAHICRQKQIDLVVVGPELPLVRGLRDFLASKTDLSHVLMVGPGQSGARLEGSKDFSKQFMLRNGIHTAKARTFTETEIAAGLSYLEGCRMPIVLKADGLAAGKGVIIAPNLSEAKTALRDMLVNHLFGEASARVLVEEYLSGIEVSVFVLTDGENYVLLPEAKDYKRIGENDEGPNTGGMGAVSPVPFADETFMRKVKEHIIEPTIDGLKKENIPYCGFIFFGLMNVSGEPYVIEYNVRLGDPETEALIPRIETDLVDLLSACARGQLKGKSIEINPQTAVTVMMVSGGYPGNYAKGKFIQGLQTTAPGTMIFHAGTKPHGDEVVTDGGRVLTATGLGGDVHEARKLAYRALEGISFEHSYFRRDIGVDLQQTGGR